MQQIAVLVVLGLLSPVSAGAQVPASGPEPSAPAGAAVRSDDAVPPVSSLFRDLAGDFRRLPSIESAVILGVAGGASLGLARHDASITSNAAASVTLDRVLEAGEVIGGGTLQMGAALATYLFGRATDHPRSAIVGADLFRAQLVNAALTQGLKFAVRRDRPDGGRFSFPSGHSSSSFAFATVLARHHGWKAAVPGYAVAAYVAGSRLQENRHYASDVVFGAAMGIVAGRAVTIGRGNARFAVSPSVSAGGAGVSLVWLGHP